MTSLAAQIGRSAFAQSLKQAWSHYLRHLGSAPVRTKACTSVVAAVLGDAIAQHVSKPKDVSGWRFDWGRTARFAFFAGAFGGPVGHYWYKLLDSRVMPHAAKSPKAVLSKVLLDQLLFAPACTPVFYLYKTSAEGRPREIEQELREKFWPTLIAGYKLWPAAHLINFAFVPPSQRILYANVVSVAGTYLLSRAAAGDYRKPREMLYPELVVSSDGRS